MTTIELNEKIYKIIMILKNSMSNDKKIRDITEVLKSDIRRFKDFEERELRGIEDIKTNKFDNGEKKIKTYLI